MKHIVIIGGGFTGARCAQLLQHNFNVTLIDNKDYFEFTPGILRTILEPEHEQKIQVLHNHYLKKATALNGEVTNVTDTHVTVGTEKIPFDYLIIASGSKYSSPIKEKDLIPATRAKELRMYHKKLADAKRVLIIGGGLVGVELAAEICTHYKDKEITLVHSGKELIPRNNEKSRTYAEAFLKKNGVKILFGERVQGKLEDRWDRQTGTSCTKNFYITKKGTKIETDIAFICIGIESNYKFMEKSFKKQLTERNQVSVNPFLQIEGKEHIFSGGDIAGIVEEKTAQTAEKHADHIVKNIHNLERNKPLETYKSKKRPLLISLGKKDGIMEGNKLVMTGRIPGMMKSLVEWKTMIRYR